VLQCGFLPPVSSGFETFRRERSDEAEVLEDDSTGPYDTHPPTTVRLQALSMLPPHEPAKSDQRNASSLVNDLPGMERRIIESVIEPPPGGWKPVDWRDCAESVFVPHWYGEVARVAQLFSFVRFKDLPSMTRDRVVAQLGDHTYAQILLGRAAGLALARDGWVGTGSPGDPVWFTKGPHRMNPSAMVRNLWAGKLSEADWRQRALEANVSELPVVHLTVSDDAAQFTDLQSQAG
jgi:hypothetical protein